MSLFCHRLKTLRLGGPKHNIYLDIIGKASISIKFEYNLYPLGSLFNKNIHNTQFVYKKINEDTFQLPSKM